MIDLIPAWLIMPLLLIKSGEPVIVVFGVLILAFYVGMVKLIWEMLVALYQRLCSPTTDILRAVVVERRFRPTHTDRYELVAMLPDQRKVSFSVPHGVWNTTRYYQPLNLIIETKPLRRRIQVLEYVAVG